MFSEYLVMLKLNITNKFRNIKCISDIWVSIRFGFDFSILKILETVWLVVKFGLILDLSF